MITRAEAVRRAKEEGLDPRWAGKMWDLMELHAPEKVLPDDWVEGGTVVGLSTTGSGEMLQVVVPDDMPKADLNEFFSTIYGFPLIAVIL